MLRLEGNKAIIYINDERFMQCKFLLLNRKIEEIEDLLLMESIDELA
jgi:hypothetical protein